MDLNRVIAQVHSSRWNYRYSVGTASMVLALPRLKIGHYLFNKYRLVEFFIQERLIRAKFIMIIMNGFHSQRRLTKRCEIPPWWHETQKMQSDAQFCKSDLIKAMQIPIKKWGYHKEEVKTYLHGTAFLHNSFFIVKYLHLLLTSLR